MKLQHIYCTITAFTHTIFCLFNRTVGPTLEPTVQPDTGKPTVKPKPPPTVLADNPAATLMPVTNEPSSKQPTQEPSREPTLEPSYYVRYLFQSPVQLCIHLASPLFLSFLLISAYNIRRSSSNG